FAAARRAARVRPTEALLEAATARRPVSLVRVLAGVAILAAGVGVLVLLAQGASGDGGDAPAATMVLMLAAALLWPLLALPFVTLLGLPVMAIGRAPGLLARANARTNPRRTASVATPLMLAVALIGSLWFGKSALQQQTTEQTEQRVVADHVVRAEGAPG